jgi:hypothetical protein
MNIIFSKIVSKGETILDEAEQRLNLGEKTK